MPASIITALEIGTSTVKVLMAEIREDGGLMIAGIGESESRGIHKGEVTDFDLALNAVRKAMEEAEANARRTIGDSLYLAASGGQVASQMHSAKIPVLNEYDEPGGEITEEDVEHVLDVARKVPLAEDRIPLHTLRQTFRVDDRGGIDNPVRLSAQELEVGMLLIHGRRATVDNLRKLLLAVPVTCEDAAFAGFCSSLAVLTDEQKFAGAVVIDLGGGTTDYVVFNDGFVQLAGSIAIGGSHVTEDICAGLNINRRQAEALKKTSGSAVINTLASELSFSVPADGGFSGRVVRSVTLHTIIHERMEETFQLINGQIEAAGLSGVLSAGVLLTGGGSALEGAVDLAQQVFNAPAQVGKVTDCVGISTRREGARFAAVLGAVRYAAGQIQEEPEEASRLQSWFRKLWGGHR
jgi:cell division protein FtsA